ncbi:hypothetical protein PRZ48_002861 [Zasmidium cellare]|uniref:DOC domain-containing protein n=1 Tax=Zasmidium cellare TaxID=395010 RepID=A0ABR0EUY8_ZASCE|nr:hypothetical protein PRZ48_002861 [Zasmidium cellare]
MANRHHGSARNQRVAVVDMTDIDIPSDELDLPAQETAEVVEEEEVDDDGEADEEDDGQDGIDFDDAPFPPPGLKEISSLASWTVSTAKPGNGVAALRSPDTSLYWQSDGPQPHLLSIHFFKLVSIVHMRIFLDFVNDESYTPTKIQFLAGMGVHDIQQFAEMSFEQPTGWIDVDFSEVGPIEDDDENNSDEGLKEVDWSKRPALRAFLVQVRILENHQNGKDTHLRAVQLFARDEMHQVRRVAPVLSKTPKQNLKAPVSKATSKPLPVHTEPNNIKLASWMMEPDLR